MLRETLSPGLLGAQQRRQTSADLWKGWGLRKAKLYQCHTPRGRAGDGQSFSAGLRGVAALSQAIWPTEASGRGELRDLRWVVERNSAFHGRRRKQNTGVGVELRGRTLRPRQASGPSACSCLLRGHGSLGFSPSCAPAESAGPWQGRGLKEGWR